MRTREEKRRRQIFPRENRPVLKPKLRQQRGTLLKEKNILGKKRESITKFEITPEVDRKKDERSSDSPHRGGETRKKKTCTRRY